jgi:putative transposase
VFFTYYNHEHRHSGIGLHTPYSVHIGTAHAILWGSEMRFWC